MSKDHVSSLDGIRGIAILMVILTHLELFRAIPGDSAFMMHIRDLCWAGWSGVDLFFVLSGFLITGILLDTVDRGGYFSNFYMRRILRIFPLYYCVLSVSYATTRLIIPRLHVQIPNGALPTAAGWTSYLFYVQNWRMPDALLGHFWSLGVEEQFYALWPVCVFFLPRRYLVRVCASAIVVSFMLRIVLLHLYPPGSALIMQNTFARMDTLLAGGFCAIAVRNKPLLVKVRRLLPALAACSLVAMLTIDFVAHEIRTRGYYTQSFGYSFLALGYGTFVVAAYLQNGQRKGVDRICQLKWLQSFGKYSYGIYVYHHPLLLIGSLLFTGVKFAGFQVIPSFPYAIFMIGVSYLVAWCSYHLLEKRFLAMKSRFDPRLRAKPVAVSSLANASGIGS